MALPADLHPPIPAVPLPAADGIRLVVVRDGGTSVWVHGRRGGALVHSTRAHADLARAAALQLPDGCVLEGILSPDTRTITVTDLLAIDHQDIRAVPDAVRRLRLETLAAEWRLEWRLAADAAPVEVAPRHRPRRARRLALESTN